MINQTKLLKALQNYPENDLTKNGIIPLLEKMGYEKVEFFGGQKEEGKDIVIWEIDKWGTPTLRVAQVKHFKFTNTASDSKSLQSVINQLTACFVKSLPYTDKIFRKPIEVLLISTHIINTKNLLTRFDKELQLKDQNIIIIDGIELAKKFVEFLPEFVKKIAGSQYELESKLTNKFSNDILLKALGNKTNKDIKSIYSDIDFSLGKMTTSLFFNSDFIPKKEIIEITANEWSILKSLLLNLKTEFELSFLEHDIEFIENKFKTTISENNILSLKHSALIKSTTLELERKHSLLQKRNSQTKVVHDLLDKKETIRINQKGVSIMGSYSKFDYTKILNDIGIEQKKLNKLKEEISKIDEKTSANEKQRDSIEKKQQNLKLSLSIDGSKLANQIISKRKWIENNILTYNKSRPSTLVIKKFIKRCDLIISLSSHIFDPTFGKYFNCIGYNRDKRYRLNYESTRFRLPIEDIFDTGLNISVLGEAGAGKSTSLEMYAHLKKDSDKTVILVPLGYIVQNNIYSKEQDLESLKGFILENLLVDFLNNKGIKISLSEFQQILRKGKVILLLDGLDEAIKVAPFLPAEINKMSVLYNGVQFILTARMHGSYIASLPFFSVTLLPFTNEQRADFIRKWFENETDAKIKIKKITSHLEKNPSVSDITKNPLLTTTMCVLAQHNISLPKTEIRLYDERLRLFTGYYDNVKRISTRIESVPNNLDTLSQKLAFYLHKESKRDEHIDILKNKAKITLQNKLDITEIESAFSELIHPCEILVPMSQDGKYGFGHLRFQEHLAAKELMNRNIDIIPLLKQDWWKGALKLFVQMSDNIDWLIKEINEYGLLHLPIVKEFVESRNKIEKEKLNQLIKDLIILESANISNEYLSLDDPS